MRELYLKDILASEACAVATFDDATAVGDALIAEDGTVTVKENGGIMTKGFTSSEDVAVIADITSNVHLTLRIISRDSKGELHYDPVPPYTSLGAGEGKEKIARYFDAANLAVYHDAAEFYALIECKCAATFKIDRGVVRTKSPLERLSVYAEELEGIIKNIDKRLALIEYGSANNTETIISSPSGKKFMVSVDDDGNLHSAPIIPKNVLFMGNSLLLGMGHYGMCATDPEHDYFSIVSDAIKEKAPGVKLNRVHGAAFEQLEDPEKFDELWSVKPNIFTGKPTCESFTPDLDLIVIQLVENVNSQIRMDTFESFIDKFILNIKERSPRARIVWVHGWWDVPRRDAIVEDACRRHRIGCIYIGDINCKETQGEYGQTYVRADGSVVPVPGLWLGHPGNEGMKQIAERIIDFLKL